MDRRSFMGATGTVAAGLLGGATATTGAQSGTLEEIEILTDEYGVSHVYADDVYSLSYGNGYVQARDRLFQMDALRLVGRGESARWLGPAQLPSDIEVRRDLYSREEINRQWEDASETTKEALRGFADGVNRRMVELAAQGELPGEFAALGRAPEPWKPEDSIAFINYAIGFFGVNGGSHLSSARTLAEMFDNFDTEAEAWDAYGDLNRVVVPEDHYGSVGEHEVDGTDERALDYDEVSDGQLAAIRAAKDAVPWGLDDQDVTVPDGVTEGLREARGMLEGFRFGSNAIIVDDEHSAHDKPILGAGPQMGLFKPPIPYEIGLHGAGFDVVGMGVVAAPALVIGRTPEIAWTVTTSGDEMIDTIAVELDEDDRHRYRWDGEWHEMSTEQVTHYTSPVGGVAQGETDPGSYDVVRQEVARVEQEGTSMPVIAWNPEENIAYCQRPTTRMEELEGAFMWAEVGRSNSIDEFESYLSEFPFGFNFHVVSDDEIAFFRTGKLPERRGDADPRLPKPPAEHDWGGFDVGTNVGASVRNPDRGYVVNWNNAPAAGWRESSTEQQWGTVHRVDVMARLVEEALDRTGGELTRQDVADIVEDCGVEHPYAPRSVPAMVDAVQPGHVDGQLKAMGEELQKWADIDYSFRPGSDGTYDNGGMAIWEETRKELQELVFRDELGEQTPTLNYDPTAIDGQGGGDPHAADHGATVNEDVTLVDAIDDDTEHDWFDVLDGDNRASHKKQRDAVIRKAMQRAAATLEERYDSDDPSDWLLENRQIEFSPLGASNPDRLPMSNRSSYQQSVVIGEGLEHSGSVLPPSNSGHQNAAELVATQAGEEPDRLTDQLDVYANFDYKPHPVTREQVEERAVESETIRAQGHEAADTVRPASDLAIKLLSVPGGGLRAVRDVATQAGWSFDGLLDDVEEGPSGATLDDQASTAADGDETESDASSTDLL
ncbi:penicillin acylase family protein [Natronomonas salina]|uniref:penicillin acylase family protein n=1 Tax=Natronomonas salina TaxID=1710540 RepID=UPI0015B5C9FA|nr:penicillin acylase family protein [Natronomonas salina]QLD87905.1 penicillin acylase family protein [Natronomonas salina]